MLNIFDIDKLVADTPEKTCAFVKCEKEPVREIRFTDGRSIAKAEVCEECFEKRKLTPSYWKWSQGDSNSLQVKDLKHVL